MDDFYGRLQAQLRSLVGGEGHFIADLANASALIYDALCELNWAGFYLVSGDKLVLGPFQGKVACIEIPFGRGVCGTAYQRGETIVVPDVHAFPGHIACDCASNSEIVIPIRAKGGVAAVLDIDSPIPDRFSEEDRLGLEALAKVLEEEVFENA